MSIEQEFADKLVQYKHIIYKVCFMYADNKDDVNDLFQESVFNIWKSYKNFRGESSFVTWVYRISLNTCISDFRKKKKYDYVPLEQQVDILEDCEHNETAERNVFTHQTTEQGGPYVYPALAGREIIR